MRCSAATGGAGGAGRGRLRSGQWVGRAPMWATEPGCLLWEGMHAQCGAATARPAASSCCTRPPATQPGTPPRRRSPGRSVRQLTPKSRLVRPGSAATQAGSTDRRQARSSRLLRLCRAANSGGRRPPASAAPLSTRRLRLCRGWRQGLAGGAGGHTPPLVCKVKRQHAGCASLAACSPGKPVARPLPIPIPTCRWQHQEGGSTSTMEWVRSRDARRASWPGTSSGSWVSATGSTRCVSELRGGEGAGEGGV